MQQAFNFVCHRRIIDVPVAKGRDSLIFGQIQQLIEQRVNTRLLFGGKPSGLIARMHDVAAERVIECRLRKIV